MRSIFYILLLFFYCVGFSQKVKILDQETGKTIKNVLLFNKNKSKTAVSNSYGIVDVSSFLDTEIIYFSHLSYTLFRIKKETFKAQKFTVYLTRESEQLNEIVLSVFKKKAKTSRIAEQIAVLTEKEIVKISPQTTANMLAVIPGIKVQKSQLGGGSPVLRGMESNRVLLVVDGIRLNNAIYRKGHIQNTITVSPNILERTEIVFGPSSVIYGSDALGGVIHYYTKTPKLSEEKKINSQLFSRFSTVNQEITTSFTAQLRFPKWASLTNVSYSNFGDLRMGKNRTHGFKNWGKVFYYSENNNGNYTENPTKNTNTDLQRNTGYNQTDILQKLFVPLNKKADLHFNIQYSTSSKIPRFDRLTELTEEGNNASLKFAEWYYGPQQRILISPQLALYPNKKWMDKGTLTLGYQNIRESRIQRKFDSPNRTTRKENVNIYSINGDFSGVLAQKRNLGYGFEFSYNTVSSKAYGETLVIDNQEITSVLANFNVQTRYPDGGSNYVSAAVYANYRQDISSKTTLNTGVRFTYTALNAKWVNQTFITLPQTDISLKNSALTATIGYVYKPNKNWQINSVLSSGFRSPNIDDVGRIREKSGNITLPNIYLKPEFAYNAEIGIQKYFNTQKFKIGGNFYYTLLDNYIQRDFVYDVNGNIKQITFDEEQGNSVTNQNKGNAYITGFTLNYQGELFKNWKTTGFITYTQGRTLDSKEPMSSIPPLFGQFNISYQKNKWLFGTLLRFNSHKKATFFNVTEGIDNLDLTPVVNANTTLNIEKYYGTPSWVTLGVNSTYSMNKYITLQARLDNLFDTHYREFASGISAPGRNFSISFIADF